MLSVYFKGKTPNSTSVTVKLGFLIILFPDQITARGVHYHQHDYLGGQRQGVLLNETISLKGSLTLDFRP